MDNFCRAPVAPIGTRKLREELAEPREPVLLLVEIPLGGFVKELEVCGPQLGMEGKLPNSPAFRPGASALENWSPSLLGLDLDTEEDDDTFRESLRRSLSDLLCVLGVPMPRDAGTCVRDDGGWLGPALSRRPASVLRPTTCCMADAIALADA